MRATRREGVTRSPGNRTAGVLLGALLSLAATGCSRSTAENAPEAGKPAPAAAPVASAAEPCTTHDKIAATPCRNGSRTVDPLPQSAGLRLELSHCPLDDCGSGGCTYEVFGVHEGCLRTLGSVHGVSIDIAAPDGAAPTIRTWGTSGTTHVGTTYEVSSGKLVPKGRLVCEYGGGKALPPECPKL